MSALTEEEKQQMMDASFKHMGLVIARPMAQDLTKREYFAAMAMQGWLASFGPEAAADEAAVARFSVRMADELLKALKETP